MLGQRPDYETFCRTILGRLWTYSVSIVARLDTTAGISLAAMAQKTTSSWQEYSSMRRHRLNQVLRMDDELAE